MIIVAFCAAYASGINQKKLVIGKRFSCFFWHATWFAMCTTLCNSLLFLNNSNVCLCLKILNSVTLQKQIESLHFKIILQCRFLFVSTHAIFNVGFSFQFYKFRLIWCHPYFLYASFSEMDFYYFVVVIMTCVDLEGFKWHEQLCQSRIASKLL